MSEGFGSCSVCLGGLLAAGPAGDTLATTGCGHVYHFNCILQSLEYKKKCPNCNAKLEEGGLHKIAPSYLDGGEEGGGGGGGGQKDTVELEIEAAEARRKANTLESHVKSLQGEIEESKAQQEAAMVELKKYQEKLSSIHGKYTKMARENASLWDDIRTREREIAKLNDVVVKGRYQQRLEETGVEEIAGEVLAAGSEVKNNYIKNLMSLLKAEKGRVSEGEERASLLEDTVLRYKRKLEKYKKSTSNPQTPTPAPSMKRKLSEAENRLAVRSLPAPRRHVDPTPTPEEVVLNNTQLESLNPRVRRKKSLIGSGGGEEYKPEFDKSTPRQVAAPALAQAKMSRYLAK